MNATVKQSAIYIILIIILLATTFTILHGKKYKKTTIQFQQTDSYMTNVHSTLFDDQGMINNTLSGTNVTYNNSTNITLIEHLYATARAQSGPDWQINADHGRIIDKAKIIYLDGHVKLTQPPGKDSQDITLLTTELTYYPDRKFAETTQPVTITQPGMTLNAIGMTADLNKGIIKFAQQTRGQYVPTETQKK
jgi:LPS export ABC transporter protein LptC